MICIIFTRTRLLTGAKLKSAELLSLDGKFAIPYGARSMVETLTGNLKTILNAYEAHLKKSQVQLPKVIPTAIAFPPELSDDPLGKRKMEEVMQVLAKWEPKLEIVHADDLGHAYLQGLKTDEKTLTGPCLMLDALDDNLNMYYQKNGTDPLNGNGKVLEFAPVSDLGVRWGDENLINELVGEFRNAGLQVNEKDKADLGEQVRQRLKEHKYTLKRSSGAVNIQADIEIPEKRYKDVTTSNRVKLKERLSTATLDAKGVQKVVLMGEYLHNDVIREYLDKDLQLAARIITAKPNGAHSEYQTIVEGLMERTNIAIEAKAELERKRREEEEKRRQEEEQRRMEAEKRRREEEERKRKEEEEKRRREEDQKRLEAEKMAQMARNKLLEELRTTCVSADKSKEYELRFVPQGIKLGMPKEVILWNITEAIKNSTLLPGIKTATAAMAPVQSPPQPTAVVSPVQKTVETSTTPDAKRIIDENAPKMPLEFPLEKEIRLHSLNDLFEIKGVLLDMEFATKKAQPVGDKTMKVIKLLSKEEMLLPARWEAFQKLYQKELTYYGELSEIETAAEGKYYSRDYIERTTLKDYAKKAGMTSKDNFAELASHDLKFILQVFKEVENLNVSHADLSEHNILVVSKRKWNLQREVEIKFVGFTSKDCKESEMITQLHTIWGKLLGEAVYKEFREKLGM